MRLPTGFHNCSSFLRSHTERTQTSAKTFYSDLKVDNTKPLSHRKYSTKALICRKRRWRSFWAAAVRRANTLNGSGAFSANERTKRLSFTRSRLVGRFRPPLGGVGGRPKLLAGGPRNSLNRDHMVAHEIFLYLI